MYYSFGTKINLINQEKQISRLQPTLRRASGGGEVPDSRQAGSVPHPAPRTSVLARRSGTRGRCGLEQRDAPTAARGIAALSHQEER